MRLSGAFPWWGLTDRWQRVVPVSAAVFVGALAAVGPASASTLAVDEGTLRFSAAHGEVNKVTATDLPSGNLMIVTDTGSTIHVGAGCVQVTPHEGRCSEPFSQNVVIDLADGDDSANAFKLGQGGIEINGGGGDDTIKDGPQSGAVVSGGRGDDKITVQANTGGRVDVHGDAGDDTITSLVGVGVVNGDAGDDTLTLVTMYGNVFSAAYGGAGNDRISATGGTDIDLIDGGSGFDVITTSDSATATVIETGPGLDVVITSGNKFPTANTINTGPGHDYVDGGGGGDTIDCGPSIDIYVAYPGDTVNNCEIALTPAARTGGDTSNRVRAAVEAANE